MGLCDLEIISASLTPNPVGTDDQFNVSVVVIEVIPQLQIYSGCAFEVVGDSVTIGIDMSI